MDVKLSVDGQDGKLIAQSIGLRDLRTGGDRQLQLYDRVCYGVWSSTPAPKLFSYDRALSQGVLSESIFLIEPRLKSTDTTGVLETMHQSQYLGQRQATFQYRLTSLLL